MKSSSHQHLLSAALVALVLTACNSPSPDPTPVPAAEASAPEAPPAPDQAAAEAAQRPAEAAPGAAAPGAPVAAEGSAAAALVPPADCATPRPTEVADAAKPVSEPVEQPQVVGAAAPTWALRDVQPQSCGAGAIYGLDAFRGHVTVVALLSATCGYCLAQAQKLEEMSALFQAMGHEVQFVIVNHAPTAEHASALLERVSFPVFQDVAEVDAWGAVEGAKDDFFVYDANGRLLSFLRASPDLDTNLSTPTGFVTVKNQLLAALGLPKEDTPPPSVAIGQDGQGLGAQGQGGQGQGGRGRGGQGQGGQGQ